MNDQEKTKDNVGQEIECEDLIVVSDARSSSLQFGIVYGASKSRVYYTVDLDTFVMRMVGMRPKNTSRYFCFCDYKDNTNVIKLKLGKDAMKKASKVVFSCSEAS